MSGESKSKKRVLVVGAGAAGMACCDSLSLTPEKFDVVLVEAKDRCGGQAFSIPLDKQYGAEWLNQGVQGGSHIYQFVFHFPTEHTTLNDFSHTFHHFHKNGVKEDPVDLQVSFGKDRSFWTNAFPTELLQKHAAEIKRFETVMRVIRWTEAFWALIPIRISLKMWFFSDDFINFLILPSLALFLGTGNATPHLPTILMERLYTSPTYGMWYPVDPAALSSNLPPMLVFPEMTKFYNSWQAKMEERGVTVRLNSEVTEIVNRSKKGGVTVKITSKGTDGNTVEEHFDEIVICVLADTAKKMLGKNSTWTERRVLGATKWSDDITVTHTDTKYMEKWYTNFYDDKIAVSKLGKKDYSDKVAKAKDGFKPMYYIKQTPKNPKLLEMSFDCSNFQSQLSKQNLPFDKHVFQTIFLNRKDQETWSIDEIDKSKIVREDDWHQLMHEWTHYLFVVPWMWLLNGVRSTTYAGSWTLVNAHELAVISGMAAAYSIGAEYPEELEKDSWALLCFRLYLLLSHMKWYKKRKA